MSEPAGFVHWFVSYAPWQLQQASCLSLAYPMSLFMRWLLRRR